MTVTEEQWQVLMAKAAEAAEKAYAPFSRFKVGAALLGCDGEVVIGSNVENSSYPLSICAERVAVATAVSHGSTSFKALALSVPGPSNDAPCGACRQVLAEFCRDLPIRVQARNSGQVVFFELESLLPFPFKLER